jgi:hypothetical protein
MTARPLCIIVLMAAVVALLTLATPTTAVAGPIVGTWTGANCYPFSCAASDTRTQFQQVYASSAFADPLIISSISFFQDPGYLGLMDTASYEVSLSTTSSPIQWLDPNWANNIGSNSALFGTYTLGGTMPAVLTLTGTPFYYDPALGNLLMHVNISGLTEPHGYQSFFKADGSATVTSRMWATGATGLVGGSGLVTEFNGASAVPDGGSTLAMLGLAMMAVAGARRKFGI